ncbi:MAG: UbiA family prenyltransferase [Lewinellaceae bacterium]|nr:UbiA family prenyltransferase [Lewinellaceae bacterium]
MDTIKTWLVGLFLFAWTAVCAVLMMLQTKALAGLGLGLDALALFVFSSTIFAYNALSQATWRKWGAALMLAPLLYSWWHLPWHLQLSIAAPGFLWGIYHGIPGKLGLRDLPWLKPFAVALAWAAVTVWLPLAAADWLRWTVVLLGRAAFVFGLALGYDLIDRGEDRRQGLRTLAGILGVQATLRVANIAFGISALAALFNTFEGLYSWSVLVWYVFSLALSAWLLRWQLRRFGPQQWQKITIDALMVLQALGVIIGVGGGL